MNKKRKIDFYCQYSILFVFFMLFILYFYYSKGKSTVNIENDGFKQVYRALLYISNYYKEILNNIFIKHSFVIPQWDFVLGEGGDIIETFHYYGLGDPINIFSVFFNESNLYIFHDISIFVRMYIAGFVFSKLCFYEKYENTIVVLSGSLLYAFSSYAMVVLTNFLYFINPLMYFPLVILGVEKVIKENKGILLTISVVLTSITSIYFFYMIAIATAMYVAVRLLTLNFDFKKIISLLLEIFIYSLFGLLISGVVFFPAAYSMLNNARTGTEPIIPLFYDLNRYLDLFTYLVFNDHSGWYHGGYTILGFFGIVSTIKNKGNKTLKYLLLASLVIMSLPLLGSLFNGMTYIVERYEFFLHLLVIFSFVACYENLSNNKSDILTCLILLVIYTVVSIFFNFEENKVYILLCCLGIATLLGFSFINNKKIKSYICLFATIVSIIFTIGYKYLPFFWNYAEMHGGKISILTNIHNEEPSVFNKIEDSTFYRYSGSSLPDNVSVNGNKSSTGYYWSLANNNIVDFRLYNGFHDEMDFCYYNYDGDYILNTLSGVKYYFTKDGERIPYGYKLCNDYDDNNLFDNEKVLPLVYGYDNCISIEDYQNTHILERKELITQAAVVDGELSRDFDFKSDVAKVKAILSSDSEIELNEDSIVTSKPNSTIELSYESQMSGEYYFVIEDLHTDVEMYISVTNQHNIDEYFVIKNRNSHAYGGRHSFVVNLGYYDSIKDTVKLNIPSISNMKYKNMGIYCLPLSNSIENLEKLNCIQINNLNILNNSIHMDIESSKDKFLCFSIPNYDGWDVYLDGHKIKVNECNIMYMGFQIEKGQHSIDFKYSTPLLKFGFITTLISTGLFVIFESIKNKKEFMQSKFNK